MNGSLCHGREKMTEGGSGAEERPSRSISRVYSRSTANRSQTASEKRHDAVGVDFFSQARKMLSQRSPFDIPEAGGSVSGLLSAPALPSGLASLLKQTDNSKKHKKSASGTDKKSSRQGEKVKETGIWAEKEVYFRDLTLPDIDSLSDITLFKSLTARKKCFLIPHVGNEPNGNLNLDAEVEEKASVSNENGYVGKEGKGEQLMEIDSEDFVSNSTDSLEWLLGCRSRVLLTSDRPSKKRKLVGEDAVMEKILIACPCDGNSSLCHFCCGGDITKESNRLIVCSSCKVAVHKKCYGVQNDVDSSWLCSSCSDGTRVKPCVLCPKQGGALKPIEKNDENGSSVEFAHLFCSQWMPEVYIEDLKKMEPIINVGGINDTRKKLVCNVCKVKCGAYVRCSHGTCRTSFHPLCAREARHRMEVWRRYGCDNVELRAFCSKHSELHDDSSSPQHGELCASGTDSSITNQFSLQSMYESQNFRGRLSNGDKIAVDIEAPDDNSAKSGDGELQEIGLPDTRSNARVASQCGETQQHVDVGLLERSNDDEPNPFNSLNFAMILKKLINRGKVNVKDVALEMGLSADSLTASLNNDSLAPDMRCKIVKWLSNHARMGSSHKKLKVNIKSLISSKDETGSAHISDNILVSKSDIADLLTVKSMPPRRRTKNMTILQDNKVICSSDEIIDDIGVMMDGVRVDLLAKEETNDSCKASVFDTAAKNSVKPDGSQDSLERATTSEKKTDQGNFSFPSVNPIIVDLIKTEEFSNFYIHPYTQKQLMQMHTRMFCRNSEVEGRKDKLNEFDGAREGDLSRLVASSNASVCCSHRSEHPKCNENSSPSDDLELSVKAKKLGYLTFSPEDEVEGEIIYYQHRLMGNAVTRNHVTDNLVSRVAKSLPQEIETARTKIWDTMLVNQYLYELREAKKQGRKERRHKEAQAVLAAATAAVAASSRISSSRKDGLEDSSHEESLLKQTASVGRPGISSQTRAKDAPSRNVVPRISSEKYSNIIQSVTDLSKGHPRSCDICRRSETVLNPILVCSGCKVAVHLGCYRNVKETTGPWRCELCEQLLLSRSSGAPSLNFWEKPYPAAECGLCGGTTGAFRKSVDNQWVHAFCAEWVLESTFKRGQVNPVEGMEMVTRGTDACCICGCKHGACIKCSYGHCQITFHPSCARSAGFCMNVKLGGGKLHHRAYCEQHSVDQRAKAETQKHGIEELKSMKQVRVELERLRLLCERIIKREKLKRELVLCSQQGLACKRDHVTRSMLVHSPFFRPDISSESATTSLKGHTEDNKSCSEAMRSDDVTVDSTLSVKKVPVPVDRRTDDSSTSQSLFVRKPTERVPFSGKQIPHRYSLASRNALDNTEWNSKFRKPIETFEKELVMTSDEASMKNSRLPKGYCYVPVDCIPKEKQVPEDACSAGQLEHNG